jgi:hypothetical protein
MKEREDPESSIAGNQWAPMHNVTHGFIELISQGYSIFRGWIDLGVRNELFTAERRWRFPARPRFELGRVLG